MTLNIDLLKKKIIYRSSYRGTNEMDKLLGSFTKKYIEILSLEDLLDLEKLLDIDDTNLYNYYNGLDCDFEFKENYINSLFKNFIYDIEKN
jgi:antitoxin CptB